MEGHVSYSTACSVYRATLAKRYTLKNIEKPRRLSESNHHGGVSQHYENNVSEHEWPAENEEVLKSFLKILTTFSVLQRQQCGKPSSHGRF